MALLPYPAVFPQDALLMMLDKFRGREVSTPDLVNAAWNVAGYSLGQSLGGGQMVAGNLPQLDSGEINEADLVASVLQQHGSQVDGTEKAITFTVIPWIVLAKVAIKLLANLL